MDSLISMFYKKSDTTTIDFVRDTIHKVHWRQKQTSKQITMLENSYILVDDIEYGFQNKIPLWLFGFMY